MLLRRQPFRPRYLALAARITVPATLDRLVALRDAEVIEPDRARSLREAFVALAHLQLRHHANAIRIDRPPDNILRVDMLRPLTRATLQEALREIAAVQKNLPKVPQGAPGAGTGA